MTVASSNRTPLVEVNPELLDQWLNDDAVTLIDVREDFEHAVESIHGSQLHPLSSFDAERVRRSHDDDTRVVFYCRTGRRSRDAAERYRRGDEKVFHLTGGIEAWRAAGHETVRAPGGPRVDVMRQVQMTAGTLVLIGVLLGAFVSPWFLILSGFVGAGLTFAGASGWCGMAKLLAHMPWNRVGAEKASGCSASGCE